MHLSESSSIPDHCIVHALSDPKDADYQSTCSHHHNDCCSQCNGLAVVIDEIEKVIEKTVIGPEDVSKEVNDELTFLTERAKRDVNAWKSHLLRSVNQDKARLGILEGLDEISVLLVQDWAMKFIPRKYRESQTDWFGKLACNCGHAEGEWRKLRNANFLPCFQELQSRQLRCTCCNVRRPRRIEDHYAPATICVLLARQCWMLPLR